MAPFPRRALGFVLVALAGALLAAGGALVYVRQEIVDQRAFTGRLVSALDDPAVRAVVTRRAVDALVERSPDLLAVRPVVTASVETLVVTPAFRRAAAATASDAQRALVDGDGGIVVRLDRAEPLLRQAVRRVSPALAAQAPTQIRPVVAQVDAGDPELRASRRVIDLSRWGWLMLAGAACAAAGALLVSPRRGRTLGYLGAAAAAAGALVAAGVQVGGTLVSDHAARVAGLEPARGRAAVEAAWDALLGDLGTAALIVAGGGLVVAALAAVARSRRGLLTGAALVAAIAAATGAAVSADDAPGPPRAGACNGSERLCDRRLGDVLIPATHNSYAAADEPGWLFANQRHPIARQLADGIRGLLIDVHAGVRDARTGRVRTDLRAEGMDRNKVAQALSPAALRTADRLAGRVGAGTLSGARGLYLCHTLCELGAEPLGHELAVIRRFLERHLDDVLVVIVEDYVPPAQIERALRDARLLRYTAALDRGAPLPTLGALVAADTRLVVLSEKHGGTPPWYLPAFSFIQDTPLGARRPAQLTCAGARGEADSPLLLLNHWIDGFPPRPSRNAPIGTAAFLRERIRACTAQRGIRGALVAVDYYERTSLVAVARELNGAAS